MLSRVDERFGFKTPQQPTNRQGANTDKASALTDDIKSCTSVCKAFSFLETYI